MAPQPEIREGDILVSRKAYQTAAAILVLAFGGISGVFLRMYDSNITFSSDIEHLQELYGDIKFKQEQHEREAAQWKYRIIGCENNLKNCCDRLDGNGSR